MPVVSVHCDLDRPFRVFKEQAGVPGQQVPRADRHQAQRHIGVGNNVRNSAHGAVPAGGDDEVDPLIDCLLGCRNTTVLFVRRDDEWLSPPRIACLGLGCGDDFLSLWLCGVVDHGKPGLFV